MQSRGDAVGAAQLRHTHVFVCANGLISALSSSYATSGKIFEEMRERCAPEYARLAPSYGTAANNSTSIVSLEYLIGGK